MNPKDTKRAMQIYNDIPKPKRRLLSKKLIQEACLSLIGTDEARGRDKLEADIIADEEGHL